MADESPRRDVVYEDRFIREAARIDEDVRRMDSALRYVEHVLSADPRREADHVRIEDQPAVRAEGGDMATRDGLTLTELAALAVAGHFLGLFILWLL